MNFIKKIFDFFNKINEDHISEYTAQCAYYTLLSFIPFIILLLSLVKYLNIENETLAGIFEAILPNIMKNSVIDIIQEMYSKSIETISISAIFMLWSASNSFYALNKGLSAIYQKQTEQNYIFLRMKGIIGAIVAILLIIVILILLVFGNLLEELINENFKEFSVILEFILHVRIIISIATMFLIFLFMYKVVSKKRRNGFKFSVFGALFASIGWYLVSVFFSIYVEIFTDFSIIYGSLATIVIIMMWLYAVIFVLLLGAEINVWIEDIINNRKVEEKFPK